MSMIQRVGAAIKLAGDYWLPGETHAAYHERVARAAIEAMPFERLIINAYLRGVEWNEENPLDREYRFKAAEDYADNALSAALSQNTLHSSSSAEPPRVADARAGGDHDVLPIGASPSAAQFSE